MVRLNFIYIIITALLLLSVALYQSSSKPDQQFAEPVVFERVLTSTDSFLYKYDTLLTGMITGAGNIGAAAVITINGEIQYLKCFGTKKAGEEEEVDAGTVFRLASVSKPITGLLAGMMDHDGIIGLDDRVVDYLPGFKLKDSASTQELSVRNLLSHTSGLVPHAYDNLVEDGVPFHIIIDSLQRVNISDRPGKLYGYQNVMFSLYDTIAEIRTAQPFEQLIMERIFTPLGMYHASAGRWGFDKTGNKAFPHGKYGGNYQPIRLNDRYYSTNPAAGINASISDLGHLLMALTGEQTGPLDHSIIDTVFTPQVKSPLKWFYLKHWNGVESKHYGLGWRIIGYHGCKIAYHGGYIRGYRAEIAVCREEGIGIAFLTNSPARNDSKVVPTFLDMYFENFSTNF